MAKLVALSEGLTGKSVELSASKTSVGRLEDNAFCLPVASVSSHHCEMWLKGDELVIKDLNSTNGTFVGETQLTPEKEVTVKPGQTIRLGQVELRYETGKKQITDQPRQTVKLGEGQTVVMSKDSGFAKKDNKINKIFIGIAVVLGLVIVVSLVIAFTKIGGGAGQ